MSAAQTAYTSGLGSSDVFFSDNATSVNNGTAASYTATTPATCPGGTTYYFTPFITQKPKAVNNITQSINDASNVTGNGGVFIGRFATLASVASSVSACDLKFTPTNQHLSIVVSNYTGRANNMVIVIRNAFNVDILIEGGLAGNGTYNYYLGNVYGGSLQQLAILVYDLIVLQVV
jgi:hypothetical protein